MAGWQKSNRLINLVYEQGSLTQFKATELLYASFLFWFICSFALILVLCVFRQCNVLPIYGWVGGRAGGQLVLCHYNEALVYLYAAHETNCRNHTYVSINNIQYSLLQCNYHKYISIGL